MFDVSRHDDRLPNKAEVLVLRGASGTDALPPYALAAGFLADRPVFNLSIGADDYVVLTDASGANRAYATGGIRFERFADDGAAIDRSGRRWRLFEDALVAEDETAARLPRVAAHRAFWFGWYAQYPDTVLID